MLVFDSWTKGSHHLTRLLPALAEAGMEMRLVHVGSWGDDPDRSTDESISGLPTRDIRAYGGFRAVLDAEQPGAVLFLSLDPLLHRAFHRYCLARRIPTVNLYPGLWSAQAYDQLGTDARDLVSYWAWQAGRVRRSARRVIPTYLRALTETRARPSEWASFGTEVVRRFKGASGIEVPPDARPGRVCVFNEDDRTHAMAKFRLPADRVAVVGVPDILKFPGLEESIGLFVTQDAGADADVVYIGTGVRGSRMKIADARDYFHHLAETTRVLRQAGRRLLLKLHYSRLPVVQELAASERESLEFCDDDDFVERLAGSAGAIVEPSSAALVPILMGKPVYLAQYGRLSGLPFGRLIASYPRASALTDVSDLARIGQRGARPDDGGVVHDWIRSVAGPLPASDMPRRVARVLREAVTDAAARRA